MQRCAERNNSKLALRLAERSGVRREKLSSWIRRKFGEWIVERRTKNGTPACSLPCVMCRKMLGKAGIRWRATLADGTVVTAEEAPASVPTSWQRNVLFRR